MLELGSKFLISYLIGSLMGSMIIGKLPLAVAGGAGFDEEALIVVQRQVLADRCFRHQMLLATI